MERANSISDFYQTARRSVEAEESLAREYQLSPNPGIRSEYQAAATAFRAALDGAQRLDGTDNGVLVAQLRSQHDVYYNAVLLMSAAVDRGDKTAAAAIDHADVDPATLVHEMTGAADEQHAEALAAVGALRRSESTILWATPAVFGLGLVLLGLFALAARAHRRRFDVQARQLHHDAYHDALTGLPNRRLFQDLASDALRSAAIDDTKTALLLLDLDGFKTINDSLGHHVGDELLALLNPRVRSALRPTDTLARLGGDEFAILVPRVANAEEALAIGRDVLASLAVPFPIGEARVSVAGSIGVVLAPDHALQVSELLQRVDVALHVAKGAGGGCCQLFEPAMHEAFVARLALEAELRDAIGKGELFLHYQPVVSLHTGAVSGVEALVRWRHPNRGVVGPSEFIPLAEDSDLIVSIGSWVLGHACRQARTFQDRYPGAESLTMAVNLSTRQLEHPGLVEEVARCLQDARLEPRSLVLEITESRLADDSDSVLDVVAALAALGVRLSIDDFGTGYSSLTRLRSFPMDELKIDQSFVKELGAAPDTLAMVAATITMAHSLGLTVVAEGVELPHQLRTLQRLGCDFVQGYLFSRPQEPAALHDTLRLGRDLVESRASLGEESSVDDAALAQLLTLGHLPAELSVVSAAPRDKPRFGDE